MKVRLTEKQKIRILNSEDVYNVMQQVLLRENKIRRNQEHFWVLGLDTENKILFVELVSLGAVNRAQVAPPEVFRMAIYKLAVKMILVHNHPSQNIAASDTDKDLTDRLLKTGKLINIDVIDHLVISETGYTSFQDKGIMDELKKSGKYELHKRTTGGQWQEAQENDLAIKDNTLEIARKMKGKGYDIDTIEELTGLPKWDIKKL